MPATPVAHPDAQLFRGRHAHSGVFGNKLIYVVTSSSINYDLFHSTPLRDGEDLILNLWWENIRVNKFLFIGVRQRESD